MKYYLSETYTYFNEWAPNSLTQLEHIYDNIYMYFVCTGPPQVRPANKN